MLAMCVRKPGDSSGGSLQSHVHSAAQTATATATVQIKSTRKQKSSALKVLKRGSKSDVAAELSYTHQQQAIPPVSRIPPPSTSSNHSTSASRVLPVATPSKVRDDPEGHLIYTRGDRLETRCKYPHLCVCCFAYNNC